MQIYIYFYNSKLLNCLYHGIKNAFAILVDSSRSGTIGFAEPITAKFINLGDGSNRPGTEKAGINSILVEAKIGVY